MRLRRSVQKPVSPLEWRHAFKRATDHYHSATDAIRQKDHRGVTTFSFHAAVSLAETLLARIAGIAASGDSPGELAYLLLRHTSQPEKWFYTETLLKILDYRHQIQTEQRPMTEEEVQDCFQKTGLFLQWVKSQLPEMHIQI